MSGNPEAWGTTSFFASKRHWIAYDCCLRLTGKSCRGSDVSSPDAFHTVSTIESISTRLRYSRSIIPTEIPEGGRIESDLERNMCFGLRFGYSEVRQPSRHG